jgi:recombinational DNA repair protein (RecF pathway)
MPGGRRRRALTADLRRYRSALGILEWVEFAAQPGARDTALFDLAERALDEVQAEGVSARLALVVFELAFLHNLGLAPALKACAACGGAAPPLPPDGRRATFSAGMGGRLCPPCAARGRSEGRRVGTLPTAVLDSASELSTWTLGRGELAGAEPVADDRLIETRVFVLRFLAYHLETLPRTHRAWLERFHDPATAPRVG